MVAEFLALLEREEDRQAISLFLNWFRQLREHGRVDPADYAEIEEGGVYFELRRGVRILKCERPGI